MKFLAIVLSFLMLFNFGSIYFSDETTEGGLEIGGSIPVVFDVYRSYLNRIAFTVGDAFDDCLTSIRSFLNIAQQKSAFYAITNVLYQMVALVTVVIKVIVYTAIFIFNPVYLYKNYGSHGTFGKRYISGWWF